MPTLLEHDFLAKQQSSYFSQKRESLEVGEVFASGDFSENYSFIIQDAVQEYHWANDQATLHPWVCYYVDENEKIQHISIIMITDHTKHDYATVYAFQQRLIDILKKKIPGLKKVYYMSDGAGSQYKNIFNFKNLCLHKKDFGVAAEWHFFATSHGKGPCDGVAGTFKRAAAQASLQRPYDNQITNVNELVAWAETWDTKITVEFVSKEDINSNISELINRRENVKTVKGTRTYHFYEPIDEEIIRAREFSYATEFKDFKIHKTKKTGTT